MGLMYFHWESVWHGNNINYYIYHFYITSLFFLLQVYVLNKNRIYIQNLLVKYKIICVQAYICLVSVNIAEQLFREI